MAQTQSTAIESIDSLNGAIWLGPIPELDRYGRSTGQSYVRCRTCGVEVITSERDHASHYAGCEHQ